MECVRRACVDANAAVAAVGEERRSRLELHIGDERAEDDPGTVAPGDQHRVLAVEADTAPGGCLAVDMLVRVDEHAVPAAEQLTKARQPVSELGIAVPPGVAREPSLTRLERRLGRPVAQSR